MSFLNLIKSILVLIPKKTNKKTLQSKFWDILNGKKKRKEKKHGTRKGSMLSLTHST